MEVEVTSIYAAATAEKKGEQQKGAMRWGRRGRRVTRQQATRKRATLREMIQNSSARMELGGKGVHGWRSSRWSKVSEIKVKNEVCKRMR